MRGARWGSLGLVVRDLEPRDDDEHDLLILTAAHLFEGCDEGTPVSVVPEEDPVGLPRHLGTVRRTVPLAPLPFIAVDAAVVKPEADFEYDNAVDGVWPREVLDLWRAPGEEPVAVRKRGAATALTEGELLPVVADHYMADVRARYTCGWWVWGCNGAFAMPGDSGSAVFDDEHRFIGLVVALEAEPDSKNDDAIAAYVHGAQQIFAALNVELDDEPPSKRRS